MPPNIANILKNLPEQSGVYRYYGAGDSLLYVGKAKNLKNRVSQYFQNNKLANNPRLTFMVSQIEQIEYTVVTTEKEALILEANLIYSLQPKYNILLKDDKSYLYIRVSSQVVPKITLTRRKYDKNSQYFGPYTKKYGIFNILRILRTIFPYCDKTQNDGKPCNYVQIKQCDGICCGKETIENYQNKINQIKKVLGGEVSEVKKWLHRRMADSIILGNYELAGLWRDRLNMLEDVISDQKIILPNPQDLDIVTVVIENDIAGLGIASVFVQNIREGKIINLNNFLMTGSNETELEKDELENLGINQENNQNIENFLQTFLVNYYAQQSYKPEVLLNIYENNKV